MALSERIFGQEKQEEANEERLAVFGEAAIVGLIADREFIGTAWMRSLAERDIPFILRIKDTFHVRLSDRRQCQVRSLFRKVGVGGRRYIREDCRLGSRDSSLGPVLSGLAPLPLADGTWSGIGPPLTKRGGRGCGAWNVDRMP